MNFRYPLLVLLTSIMENIGPTTYYNFFILIPDNSNNKKIQKLLNTLIPKYGESKLNIKYLQIKESQIPKNVTVAERITKATYYRILLPQLLPEIDKIIYLDSDVINLRDLTEMYNLEMSENTYFLGALGDPNSIKAVRDLGTLAEFQINCGVLVLNLKSMRKFEIGKKILNFSRYHNLKQWDNTAINAVCTNNIKIISLKYNLILYRNITEYIKMNNIQSYKYRYTIDEIKESYSNPINLHYSGHTKPWNDLNYEIQYWWYYAKNKSCHRMSPIRCDIV